MWLNIKIEQLVKSKLGDTANANVIYFNCLSLY